MKKLENDTWWKMIMLHDGKHKYNFRYVSNAVLEMGWMMWTYYRLWIKIQNFTEIKVLSKQEFAYEAI